MKNEKRELRKEFPFLCYVMLSETVEIVVPTFKVVVLLARTFKVADDGLHLTSCELPAVLNVALIVTQAFLAVVQDNPTC